MRTKLKMNQVQEINENEFDEQVLASKQPTLVGFVAGWSQASERIEPVLKEVAKACNGVVRVFRLDVDDNPDLGTEYGIQSVPTLILFSDGAVRIKLIGTVSAKAILAKLQLPQRNSASTRPMPGIPKANPKTLHSILEKQTNKNHRTQNEKQYEHYP